VFSTAFGAGGSGAGQLAEPDGVAVNEASGDVYVVDRGNDRVEYFTAGGAYVGEFNGSGADAAVEGKAAPTGRLSEPTAIAIDNEAGSPSYGDVYVADAGHEAIDKFTATGEYVGQITESSSGSSLSALRGLAVDGHGKLWVCQQERAIDAFNNAMVNEFLSKITSTGLPFSETGCGFAVDAEDDIYASDYFTGIGKLNDLGGVLVEEFDSLLHQFFGVRLGQVAVDLANDEVYIGNADNEGSIGRFTSDDRFVEKFGAEHLTRASGIAVDAETGAVVVADEGSDRIDVFSPEPEARPKIESAGPSDVAGTSATLEAQLKATGPQTTYYFQYGTADCSATPALCTDLPALPGASIGGGFESQSVSIHVQGLQAGTEYHFRVIATNALGTSEGAEESFATQAAGGEFALPDGRVWERVTPGEKHGAGLIAIGKEGGADIQAAEDGSAITYGATAPFATNPAGGRAPEVTQVFSSRAAPGSWSTQDISTPHEEGAAELAVGHSAEYKLFSSELTLGLFEPVGDTPLPPLPADSQRTMYLRTTSGAYVPLLDSSDVRSGVEYGQSVGFVTGTPDMSHIVLQSGVQLTSTPAAESGNLYEWSNGGLALASVLPDGKPISAGLGDRGGPTSGDVRNAISTSGSRLVFEANGHSYLRDTASEQTVQIDAAQGTSEPESAQSVYQTANTQDTRIFFTSPRQLTAGSGGGGETGDPDLYEFEVTSGEGQPLAGRLTDLTIDDNSGEQADVRGVIGASEDGTSVYFVANGVLGDSAKSVAPGDCESTPEVFTQTCNLYVDRYDEDRGVWESPRFIATLSGADSPSWGENSSDLDTMTSRVSPNGRYLAFMSERSLTGYENRDAASGVRDEEVYLYDAESGRLACASCDPTGARPNGIFSGGEYQEHLVIYTRGLWSDRWVAGNVPGWTTKDLSSSIYQSRYLSNSGRLFFDSSDTLVPADVNGQEDVYEYEPAGIGSCQAPGYGRSASVVFDASTGGCVGLISAGTSAEESAFLDASESGGDVFFLTKSRLLPTDLDSSLDIYDAHECTTSSPCAPSAALAPPPCATGDACKPAPSPQPTIYGAPSSETFAGAGNVAPEASTPALTSKSKSPTRAQKLARALLECGKSHKQRRRAQCERRARAKDRTVEAKFDKPRSRRTVR
jgi:DNA-binding beta-propeller fold protein YncE